MNNTKVSTILVLIRTKHWLKNLLIFAPVFFEGKNISFEKIYEGIPLFIAFSALASCIYIINDILDVEKDRLHPVKKTRPIASGEIKPKKAAILAVLLFMATVFLGMGFPLKVKIILAVYFISSLSYSLWLKRLVIVDIFIVATMYLMRIYAGSKLWNITLSHWIILCTFFAALFLVTAKRRAELNDLETKDGSTRSVIKLYNKDFLDHSLTMSVTATMVTYGLYSASLSRPYSIYSVLFVTFGLMRYMYLIYFKNIGQTPEDILTQDTYILLTVVLWIAYNSIIIYFL